MPASIIEIEERLWQMAESIYLAINDLMARAGPKSGHC